MKTAPLQQADGIKSKQTPQRLQANASPSSSSLKIGSAHDKYEREADAMADHIMRMPQSFSNQPLSKGANDIQRKCATCDHEEEKIQRKPLMMKSAGGTPVATPALGAQLNSTKVSGSPLPAGTNNFMSNAFGSDFSNVRVHTNSKAQQMNQGMNARAFTHGSDIYFNRGQYQPGSSAGKKLLGHELTHVVQQRSVAKTIQRSCDNDLSIGRGLGLSCSVGSPTLVGPSEAVSFSINDSSILGGDVTNFVNNWRTSGGSEQIQIDGYASCDGPEELNWKLSCDRAMALKRELVSQGVSPLLIHTIANGETDQFSSTNLSSNRVAEASIASSPGPRPEPKPERICGPNVTDWLVDQIATAKRDPIVLALRARLQGASRVARSNGFSAERVAEGGITKRMMAEWVRQGRPAKTADARTQIAASAPGQREFGRALVAATVPIFGAHEAFVMAAIKGAASTWKGLVGTGRKYDFKNRSETLGNPRTDNCPVSCNNTITLCPAVTNNCFVEDVPGNIFYAHIGRFVGWTELSLQLGSQFAQLAVSARWDPPEDTRMINFAFHLSRTLSRSTLCSAINSRRAIFDIQNCSNCQEILNIQPV